MINKTLVSGMFCEGGEMSDTKLVRVTASFLRKSFILFYIFFATCNYSWAAFQSFRPFPSWFSPRKSPARIVSIEFDRQNLLNSSFRQAIAENRFKDAERYLIEGANINSTSSRGESSLMVAARRCNLKSAKFLLQHRADLNRQDQLGRTALVHAVRESCLKVVRAFLNQPNTKIHLKDHMRKTALDYAKKASILEVDGPAVAIIKMIQSYKISKDNYDS